MIPSPEQIALRDHIRASNAKLEAQAKAEGWTFLALPTDDITHWASYGIATIEQYEDYCLRTEFSDVYKARCGFRPRGHYTVEVMKQMLAQWSAYPAS